MHLVIRYSFAVRKIHMKSALIYRRYQPLYYRKNPFGVPWKILLPLRFFALGRLVHRSPLFQRRCVQALLPSLLRTLLPTAPTNI
jgi:hypothetical protein